ncbi:MAG: 2,3,4,5-tetrahydropyridine-2,6-dicarboxylate N-succinyltransferase [Gammaproteobacteria bacterium]|nr:2,3,4,5-tetrahydropyridine-2,6-dicarboxylate N-succinyltransferase [Gammaproteobacteria bacterium]
MTLSSIHSFAFGLATKNSHGEIIEVFYPRPLAQPDTKMVGMIAASSGITDEENNTVELDKTTLLQILQQLRSAGFEEQASLVDKISAGRPCIVACFIFADNKPQSVAEVFLKLTLLSHRLALPNSLNLDGAFGVLHNLAWTNKGPLELDELADKQLQSRLSGELLEVMSVDKFPKMTNYVVPPGVRIAHTARVRLGAYIGDGTTIMHEGFVNFNAGSAGAAMIEGRISAGVMVGTGSDLGGGCSIMGTLSGGGKEVITVGENCLIGANAGIGFPIGDRCIIEAGLYVTSGTKVNVLDKDRQLVKTVKATELSGQADLLFRRNSLTGAVECTPNKTNFSLNEDLHSHN